MVVTRSLSPVRIVACWTVEPIGGNVLSAMCNEILPKLLRRFHGIELGRAFVEIDADVTRADALIVCLGIDTVNRSPT